MAETTLHGGSAVELDQVKVGGATLSHELIRRAGEVCADLDKDLKAEVLCLVDAHNSYTEQLRKNVFAAPTNPLKDLSPSVEQLFQNIASDRFAFPVDDSVSLHTYDVIRATALSGNARLAVQDASLGATRGNDISMFGTSQAGVALERSAAHYSKYSAALTNAREQILDAVSLALDQSNC